MKFKTYRIRAVYLFPPVVASLCLALLTAFAFAFPSSVTEKVLLTILFVITLIYACEQMFRRITVVEEGLQIVKFFRPKVIKWLDINNISRLILGHRSYLLLTTNRGFFFFYDNMANFRELQTDIVSAVDKERVDSEVSDWTEPLRRFPTSLVFMWGASILVVLVTLFRLTYLYM